MEALLRSWETWVEFARRSHGDAAISKARRIHLLRLTVKRLRAYVQMVRPVLRQSDYSGEDLFLRDIARSLARSRDHTVALQTIARLGRQHRKNSARKVLKSAKKTLKKSGVRPEAIEGVGGTADVAALAIERLQDSLRRVAVIEPKATGWAVIEGGLFKTCRRARNRYAQWLKSYEPKLAHECRKYTKYLMFQLEILEPVNPKKIREMCRRLSELEDKLGQLNDFVTLGHELREEMIKGKLAASTKRSIDRLARRSSKQLKKNCHRAGEKCFKKGPNAIVKGLENDWIRWGAMTSAAFK